MADGCGACAEVMHVDNPREIFRTDNTVVILNKDWSPFLGRSYLLPVRHVAQFTQMVPEEQRDFLTQVDVTTAAIQMAFLNHERGDTVRHFQRDVLESHIDYDVLPAYRGTPTLNGQPFSLSGGLPWRDEDTGQKIYVRSQSYRPPIPPDLVTEIVTAIRAQLPDARRQLGITQ